MDELTTWTRTVSTLYFTLKLVQTKGQRFSLAVRMRNSINMVIVVNTRVQDPG